MKKTLIKFVGVFLSFVMIVCGITAYADETDILDSGATIDQEVSCVSYGGISYDIYSNHATVTGVDETLYSNYNPDYIKTKVFKFPSYVDNVPVTKIEGMDYGTLTAKTIVIPKTVEYLNCKFSRAEITNDYLEEVTIESGTKLKSINEQIFYHAENLRRVGVSNTDKLPDRITQLASQAFCGCSSLKSITLPSGLKSFGYGAAFSDCINLKEISIPATVEDIYCGTFKGCTKLNKVVFESFSAGSDKGKNSLKSFGGGLGNYGGVFENCTNLKEIFLPQSKNKYEIRSNCFKNTSIECINIPNCVEYIESGAFSGMNLNNKLKTDKGEMYAVGIFGKETSIYEDIFGNDYTNVSISNRPIIAGYSYSPTNDFAIKNNYKFISVGEWTPFKISYPGDVNIDGEVTSEDALTILRASIGLVILTNAQKEAADVTGDKVIDSADALMVLRMSIGL